MANIGYATLQVIPSMKGFNTKLRAGMGGALVSEGQQAGEKTGKSFASGFAKVAAGAAVAAGVIGLGKGLVDAAVESQKVTKQTEAVLKSMGGQAGLTANQVADLSTKLSLQSGVDDELIQSASNVLLTFGKVRNEVGAGNDIFNRAQQSALDMSVALGTDLQGSTIMLGKALNDPIKGITAMTRAGVSFTQQQKDQIKAMVESGDTLGAQKLIMSEMEKQFGGSAAAQATAGDKLRVVFGNLQEALGAKLLPIVEKVAGFLATNLPKAFDAVGKAMQPVGMFLSTLFSGFTEDEGTAVENVALRIRDAFAAIASFVTETLVPALVAIGEWIITHQPVLIGLGVAVGVGLVAAFVAWAAAAGAAAVATLAAAAPVIAIGAAIAALTAGIIWAYQNWDFFRTAVDAVAQFLTGVLWPALQTIVGFIVGQVVPVIVAVVTQFVQWHLKVAEVAAGIIEWVAKVVGKVIEVGAGIASAIAGIIGKFVEWHLKAAEIVGAVISKFGEVVSFFTGLPATLGRFAKQAWEALKNGLKAAIDWIVDQIDRALGPLDELIGGLGKVAGGIGKGLGAVGGALGFASGGLVMGKAGRDVIPAFLTAGEFVMNKDAVSKLGTGVLAALNGGNIAEFVKALLTGYSENEGTAAEFAAFDVRSAFGLASGAALRASGAGQAIGQGAAPQMSQGAIYGPWGASWGERETPAPLVVGEDGWARPNVDVGGVTVVVPDGWSPQDAANLGNVIERRLMAAIRAQGV